MLYLYKTPEGDILISEEPPRHTIPRRWELLDTAKTLEVAEQKRQGFLPKVRKPRRANQGGRRKLVPVNGKSYPSRTHRPRSEGNMGCEWVIRTPAVTRKQVLAVKAYKQIRTNEMFNVIRPDGVCTLVWLPEGKEHAVLPPGWTFGRLTPWKYWESRENVKNKKTPE